MTVKLSQPSEEKEELKIVTISKELRRCEETLSEIFIKNQTGRLIESRQIKTRIEELKVLLLLENENLRCENLDM